MPSDTKQCIFKEFAGLLEARVLSGWAVHSASRDLSNRTVRLFWNKSVSYGSAYSWVCSAFVTALVSAKSYGQLRVTPLAGPSPAAFASQLPPSTNLAVPVSDSPAVGRQDVPSAAAASTGTRSGWALGDSAPNVKQARLSAGGPDEDDLGTQWLMVKALELFRKTPMCPKAAKMAELVEGERLGEGSFGIVTSCTLVASGQRVAVKKLKEEDKSEFLHEVAVLSRLRHPNVARLLDVAVHPSMCLVLVYAGRNLQQQLQDDTFPAAKWLEVGMQILAGLVYLHAKYIVHGDIKPANVCYEEPAGQAGVATIVDLGNSLVCLPGFRSCRTAASIRKTGLHYQTMGYRAIELALGDASWEKPTDCWAMGVLIAELWGLRGLFRAPSLQEMVLKIFRTLGSPTGNELAYFSTLPLFSQQMPHTVAPDPRTVFKTAPEELVVVVTGLLRLCPADRWHAVKAHDFLGAEQEASAVASRQLALDLGFSPGLSSAAVAVPAAAVAAPAAADAAPAVAGVVRASAAAAGSAPDGQPLSVLGVGGQTEFNGGRGPFNILMGDLPEPLLLWLQNGLTVAADWSFYPEEQLKADRGVEFKQKLEICGHLGSQNGRRVGLTLNNKDASHPLDTRFRAFALAFKAANSASIDAVDAAIKRAIKELPARNRGENGQAMLMGKASDWSFDLGALQIMRSNDRCDPIHYDGGASFMHAGLTLYGERSLKCRHFDRPFAANSEQGPPKELEFEMRPGHFYLGCLCGPEHYVQHHTSQALRGTPGCGDVEIVVLFRSRIFRAARASGQQTGPVPLALWGALAPVMVQCFASLAWLLPSLAACEAVEATFGKTQSRAPRLSSRAAKVAPP